MPAMLVVIKVSGCGSSNPPNGQGYLAYAPPRRSWFSRGDERGHVSPVYSISYIPLDCTPLARYTTDPRKVDVRLPGKRNSNSHGARPVHLSITMIKWIRTSRFSIKNSLSTPLTTLKPHREARASPRESILYFFFFFFFTLVTGPRRSLSLKLSDTRVYEPQIQESMSLKSSTGVPRL